MHITLPSLVKIHWCLLKLSSGNNHIWTDEHTCNGHPMWNHNTLPLSCVCFRYIYVLGGGGGGGGGGMVLRGQRTIWDYYLNRPGRLYIPNATYQDSASKLSGERLLSMQIVINLVNEPSPFETKLLPPTVRSVWSWVCVCVWGGGGWGGRWWGKRARAEKIIPWGQNFGWN